MGVAITGLAALRWSDRLLKSVRTNLTLMVINAALTPLALAFVYMVQARVDLLNIEIVQPEFWLDTPFWVTILAYVLIIDFCDYWIHRILHAPIAWDIHAVHHAEPELNWTSTHRLHILEGVLMQLSYIAFGILIAVPVEGVALVGMARVLHNNWVHVKYDLHLGPLNRLIATPRFHHWHHADDPKAYNTNFGNTLSAWDVMFGTYRVPGQYTGSYGFHGSPGNNIVQLVLWPYLKWWERLRVRTKKEQMLDA